MVEAITLIRQAITELYNEGSYRRGNDLRKFLWENFGAEYHD